MIEEAIERGDEDTVRTVIDLARATNPDEGDEIDAILAGYENDLAAANAAQALAEQQAIREAGLFDNWSGRGELGAFAASGNAENTGVTASIQLTREGIDWRHKVNARADFQSTEGVTTREQYFAAYEPNLKLGERLFLYALAQYERDRFQGFSARYAVSGGLGYQIFDNDAVTLSAKAGPAYRITQFVDGGSEDALAALVGLDFDWRITERLTLTQDTDAVAEAGGSATAIVDGSNTSLNLVTGLNAKISDNLSARLSYAYEYDSNPPAGAQSTDTLSRITIIYDF
jgi:putative salt-induced outer membrane protein